MKNKDKSLNLKEYKTILHFSHNTYFVNNVEL